MTSACGRGRDGPAEAPLEVGDEVGASQGPAGEFRRPDRDESGGVHIALDQHGEPLHPVQHRNKKGALLLSAHLSVPPNSGGDRVIALAYSEAMANAVPPNNQRR